MNILSKYNIRLSTGQPPKAAGITVATQQANETALTKLPGCTPLLKILAVIPRR